MHESEGSDLRNAAARINAERSGWDGVGFMAIENLETGAFGLVLVPKGTPRPDWSKELQDAGNAWHEVQPVAPVEDASPGNEVQPVALLENAWERYEDQQLAQWLRRRWGADLTTDDRFPELMNLLKLHLPAALVAKLPAPSRGLACGRGFNAHTVKPAALSADLRARLVAWLIPWERTLFVEGRQVCAWWHTLPAGVSLMWNPVEALHGADGRSCEEREAAGGMVQWGLITGWSSVIDAVVAYLLAMADTLDAAGATPMVPASDAPNEKPQRAKKPETLTQAKGRLIVFALASSREPQIAVLIGTPRDELVLEWVKAHASDHISASVLRALKFDGLPAEWLDLAARDYPAGCSVADLASLRDKTSAAQFRSDVTKALSVAKELGVAKALVKKSRSICSK